MAKTILIVDDSSTIRQVVGLTLKGAGYEVVEAQDGRDALAKLNGREIHLIVSDVNMPNLDGIGLIKKVKQRPDYKSTPFIMLTTESQKARNQEGRSPAAQAWLTKPFRPPALLSAVAKLV